MINYQAIGIVSYISTFYRTLSRIRKERHPRASLAPEISDIRSNDRGLTNWSAPLCLFHSLKLLGLVATSRIITFGLIILDQQPSTLLNGRIHNLLSWNDINDDSSIVEPFLRGIVFKRGIGKILPETEGLKSDVALAGSR